MNKKATPQQMLDAAHGKSVRPTGVILQIHAIRDKLKITSIVRVRTAERRRRPTVALGTDARQYARLTFADARSRRYEAIARRNAAEGAEQWFAAIAGTSCGSFEPCGPQPCPAEARKHPAVAGRTPQAAPEIIHNAFSCKTFARAGCGGRAFSASRPRAQGLPYQKEPAGYACHNCEL